MKLENTKAQMRKGFLEMITLLIISKKESYPSDIIKSLKENKLIVVEGTMYPLLTRLKNAGFLSYNWKESTSGPPRKYYNLTETGQEFLNELTATWKGLKSAVESISKTK
jgi:PadR family transcriptional regulator PadR